jgi:hypothetical protein
MDDNNTSTNSDNVRTDMNTILKNIENMGFSIDSSTTKNEEKTSKKISKTATASSDVLIKQILNPNIQFK